LWNAFGVKTQQMPNSTLARQACVSGQISTQIQHAAILSVAIVLVKSPLLGFSRFNASRGDAVGNLFF
jgi:hypothetical protein